MKEITVKIKFRKNKKKVSAKDEMSLTDMILNSAMPFIFSQQAAGGEKPFLDDEPDDICELHGVKCAKCRKAERDSKKVKEQTAGDGVNIN